MCRYVYAITELSVDERVPNDVYVTHIHQLGRNLEVVTGRHNLGSRVDILGVFFKVYYA